MNITEAVSALKADKSLENINSLVESLALAAEIAEQVYVPFRRDGSRIRPMFAQHCGEIFAAMYSSKEQAEKAGGDFGTVELSKLVDIVYSSPRIAGILIDPGEGEIPVARRTLHEHTVCKDPRLEKRDWGVGVPEYSQSDLMVIEELMDFAMEVVASEAEKNGFKLIDSCPSAAYIPNYIMEKDGSCFLVLVEPTIAPAVPKLSDAKRESLIKTAEAHGAQCFYAPVSIGSKDEGRFNAGLALTGDDYMVNFIGFIPLG